MSKVQIRLVERTEKELIEIIEKRRARDRKRYWAKQNKEPPPLTRCRASSYDEQLSRNRAYHWENRDTICARKKIYYQDNREKLIALANRGSSLANQKVRLEAMNAYGGPICKCCGEAELKFLAFDHINGGGGKHRKTIGSGARIYRWMKQNGYPPGFQILCHNCNLAKGFYRSSCPHQDVKTPIDTFLSA